MQSCGSVIAGLVVTTVVSVGIDMLMGATGIINMDNFKNNSFLAILLVILYRFAANAGGSYIAAMLAPQKPMRHVLIIGFIGLFTGILGAFFMWDAAPAFYNISIIVMAIPSALTGGKMYLKRKQA